jgi:transposase
MSVQTLVTSATKASSDSPTRSVLRPEITEYHLHTLACPDCKALTTALPPADATTGTGPRALAWIATLSGQYRLSRDNVAHLMERLCGIPMCKGTVQNACMEVSEALKKPVAELERALPKQATVHLDETSWRQGGKLAWLWVAATKAYTVFAVNAKRDTEQVRKWYPEGYSGVAHSDRWSVYTRVFGESRHQVCWAHLLRDMQGIIDRGLCGKQPTTQVQEGMKKLFEGWGEYRRGEKTREKVQEETIEQQRAVEAWAQAGSEQKEDGKWRGVGKWLMKWKGSVFRFLWEEGVEPTNNAAEQAVRSGVIWRRGSGGTKSAAGSDFVARILSVGATCRQQGKEVSEYLTEALRAWRAGEPAPSLLPA